MRKSVKQLSVMGLIWAAGAVFSTANAANWFQLQNEANPEWGKGTFFGYLQPVYSNNNGSPVRINGKYFYARPNLIGPEFDNTTRLTFQRIRFMLRGSLNPKINYFLGAEVGDNGFDYSNGTYTPKIIDAHITFAHYIPGVRISAGIIRAPGAETTMQGYMVYNFFNNFPTITSQLMQPSFFDKSKIYKVNSANGGYLVPGYNVSSNNAFRYPGIEALDWFRFKKNLEFSYGLMYGSYGKQFESDTFNGPITAGRVQLSYLLGKGGGAFRSDITGFAWFQQGKPEINGISNTMKRQGFGVTYRQGYMKTWARSFRAEYIKGSGNISVPATFSQDPVLTPAQYETTFFPGSNNKASGYYASAGLFVTPKLEVTARYDYYDRLPNLPSQERIFKNTGVALQYHFTPLTRVVVDYFKRSISIPNPGAIGAPGSAALKSAENIVNSVGNQFDISAVIAF